MAVKGSSMKRLSKMTVAFAVATMTVAPAMAAPANPAASLSVVKAVRANAPAAKGSKLGGENGGLIIAVAGGLAIIAAIIVVGSEGSKTPSSP